MKPTTTHNRYELSEWRESKSDNGFWCYLYIAGQRETIEAECRRFAFPSGVCVTIEDVLYVFGGGTEIGCRIGFIQYPPFPEENEAILDKAIRLGRIIAESCGQFSFTVIGRDGVVFESRRSK